MDSLDDNDTCKRPITNLKMHFCHWRNPTNAHNLGRNEVRWRPGQGARLAPHVRTLGLSEANVLY